MAERHFWQTDIFFLKDFFGQANYMVGCTIQESRDPQSHNNFIIILWAMAGNSLSPVRQILPIIPYLDNFWSSPRLGLISVKNSFLHVFAGLICLNYSVFMLGVNLSKAIQNWLASVKSTHTAWFHFPIPQPVIQVLNLLSVKYVI